MMVEAFICDAVRTPIGRYNGALAHIRADDLAAIPLRALIERNAALDLSSIDDVILGCANQAGEDNRNVRSEEHTSELQSLMRISYAVFSLKKKKKTNHISYDLN